MCEFCSLGPNSSRQHNGDQNDLRFAGFFSSDAIEAAVRQAGAGANVEIHENDSDAGSASEENGDGEEDDDGT